MMTVDRDVELAAHVTWMLSSRSTVVIIVVFIVSVSA